MPTNWKVWKPAVHRTTVGLPARFLASTIFRFRKGTLPPMTLSSQCLENGPLRMNPAQGCGRTSIPEDDEGWNGCNPETGSQIWRLIDINLGHDRLSFLFRRQSFEHRRYHFARSAPFGPEIDDRRQCSSGQGLVKIRIVPSLSFHDSALHGTLTETSAWRPRPAPSRPGTVVQ